MEKQTKAKKLYYANMNQRQIWLCPHHSRFLHWFLLCIIIKHPDNTNWRKNLFWLTIPEGQSPSWWKRHLNRQRDMAAGTGSWLVTSVTFRKQRANRKWDKAVSNPCDVLPPARFHPLPALCFPRQHQQLGTKYLNTQAYGRISYSNFSLKDSHGNGDAEDCVLTRKGLCY